MEEINSYNENCFEVFLGEKMIGDVTDLLIRTIQYLKKIGKMVKLSGVDEKNMPMVINPRPPVWISARITTCPKLLQC